MNRILGICEFLKNTGQQIISFSKVYLNPRMRNLHTQFSHNSRYFQMERPAKKSRVTYECDQVKIRKKSLDLQKEMSRALGIFLENVMGVF